MKKKYGNSIKVQVREGSALVRFDRGVNRNALDQDASSVGFDRQGASVRRMPATG